MARQPTQRRVVFGLALAASATGVALLDASAAAAGGPGPCVDPAVAPQGITYRPFAGAEPSHIPACPTSTPSPRRTPACVPASQGVVHPLGDPDAVIPTCVNNDPLPSPERIPDRPAVSQRFTRPAPPAAVPRRASHLDDILCRERPDRPGCGDATSGNAGSNVSSGGGTSGCRIFWAQRSDGPDTRPGYPGRWQKRSRC